MNPETLSSAHYGKNLPHIMCPERLAKIIVNQGGAIISSDRFHALLTANIDAMPVECRQRLVRLMQSAAGFNS